MPSAVVPRDGKYGARMTRNGHQRWLGTYETEDLAWRAVWRARRQAPPVQTVQDWADVWLDLFGGRANEESRARIAKGTRRFVREHGAMRLDDVTVLVAQRHANEEPGSVRHLRQMWRKALLAGIVEDNPWERVQVTLRKRPRRPVTVDELDTMAATAGEMFGEHWHDLLLFTGYSGLRFVEVRRVLGEHMIPGSHRLDVYGKRLAGDRVPRHRQVVVFEPGWSALVRQLRGGPVWRSPMGRVLDDSTMRHRFGELRRRVGLGPDVTFHSLRHFHATWLLDRGASYLDVAVQLGHMSRDGHANPSLVETVYGRPSPEAALERLSAMV